MADDARSTGEALGTGPEAAVSVRQARYRADDPCFIAHVHALFELDGAGNVVAMNAAAARLLETADGLFVVDGRLRAHGRYQNERLGALLDAYLAGCAARRPPPPSHLHVLRPSGATPYWLSCVAAAGPGCTLFVVDLDAAPATQALRHLYGLTNAECAVVEDLARGASVDEIAARHGTSRNTVRTHLRHARRKTGARREAELVRLAWATSSVPQAQDGGSVRRTAPASAPRTSPP